MRRRKRVYPWRGVAAYEGVATRHYGSTTRLTSGQQMHQLRLTCGHLAERRVKPGAAYPSVVRCEDCPEVDL